MLLTQSESSYWCLGSSMFIFFIPISWKFQYNWSLNFVGGSILL